MENGTIKMCTPVFGYELVDGNLILKSDEAEIVRQIFDWYLNGYGLAAIAQMLNALKIERFGRTSHWTASTVGVMLRMKVYRRSAVPEKVYYRYTSVSTGSK